MGDFLFGFRRWQAVDYGRVDRNPFTDKSDRFFIARRLHDYADRQIEFSSKLQIALVVRGHAHDCARAVTKQHIIRGPNRDPLVVRRIDRVRACENAGFVLRQIRSLQVALSRSALTILANIRPLLFCDD